MAYSDYGGYAYRNGARVVERSDATITPEGDTYGTPGSYPGFALMAQGVSHEEVMRRMDWPKGHAVLGDGPIYVVLYKQSSLHIHRGPERLDDLSLLKDAGPKAIKEWEYGGKSGRYIDTDHFKECEEPCHFEVDGWRITVFWREEDNHYQYVRVEQPDGTVWCGWSGYGVGAGLEDAGYGYSTSEREDVLTDLWPDAIRESA